MNYYILLVSIILITFFIAKQINMNAQNYIIDEIFHIDQTINYFNFNFKYWNNKLTTFPLLFVLTSIVLRVYNFFSLFTEFLMSSRQINLFLSYILTYVLNYCSAMINFKQSFGLVLIIYLFPLNFFFYFFYYTDTLSTLLVVSYFAISYFSDNCNSNIIDLDFDNSNDCLNKNLTGTLYKYRYKFLIGLLAVLARQNNIIWINYFGLLFVINIFFDSNIRSNFFGNIGVNMLRVTNIIKNKFIDVVLLDILFVLFFVFNKFSVVLGDKENHSLTMHLAQINHLFLIFFLFFPGFIFDNFDILSKEYWSTDYEEIKAKRKSFIKIFSLMLPVVLISDYYFMQVHPFLLADNRHYSFYYFKRIVLTNDLFRILRLVFTAFTTSCFISNYLIENSKIYLSWFICCLFILVPAQLFEFRYLALCYVLFIIISGSVNNAVYKRIVTPKYLVYFIIMNSIILYMFIFKPFTNEYMNNEISRFMW